MMKVLLKILACVALVSGLCFGQSAGASGSSGAGTGPTCNAGTIHTPFFLGAALGFGSGTGVGTERGLGLRQIEPMLGVWFPGMGFARVGYGFFDYYENFEGHDEYNVEHSDFDIELGLHMFGLFYVMGSYSRAKELSDLGDVAWNEWGAGFGSMLNLFVKTILFAEVEYRWVRGHYDPFKQKDVKGSRLQFNLGFATYVF